MLLLCKLCTFLITKLMVVSAHSVSVTALAAKHKCKPQYYSQIIWHDWPELHHERQVVISTSNDLSLMYGLKKTSAHQNLKTNCCFNSVVSLQNRSPRVQPHLYLLILEHWATENPSLSASRKGLRWQYWGKVKRVQSHSHTRLKEIFGYYQSFDCAAAIKN